MIGRSHQAKSAPMSPLGPVKVAVTVDDMLLTRGWPHAPGHDAVATARAFARALEAHGLKGIYQFSNTAQLEDDPRLYRAFDIWAEAGHVFGNHTHNHPTLNWMKVEDYVGEIETAERFLERYLPLAPCRCFRFCADIWGDSPAQCQCMLPELRRLDYKPIPVTAAFHDANWSAAYRRTVMHGAQEDVRRLQQAYVQSAVHELRLAAANARAVFGRDPVHIWLIHGTSIAADCLELILDRFREAGVEFADLDEAMADPMNAAPPPLVTSDFIFQVEKWARALGVPVSFPDPPELEEIETLFPQAGEMSLDMFRDIRDAIMANAKLSLPAA